MSPLIGLQSLALATNNNPMNINIALIRIDVTKVKSLMLGYSPHSALASRLVVLSFPSAYFVVVVVLRFYVSKRL